MRTCPSFLPFRATLASASLAVAMSSVGPAAGEGIRIEPGTVLEISAVGVPDFRYKVPVNANGEASFPLLDPMRVAGMTLDDIRADVRARLPKKVFRQRTSDGKENYITLGADEITLDIAEYRPVYVNGDVSKPGELTYRPGLTVRQAIALAGGYDLTHTRLSNPFMEAADVRSEHEGAWLEFVKQQALLAGLKASLDGKVEADIRRVLKAPLPSAMLDQIAANEVTRLKAGEEDHQKEVQHLQAIIKEADVQVSTLQGEQKSQRDGLGRQTADLDRIRGLYEKNVVPVNRVSDEQRQFAFAQERVMAVASQISQASRIREESRRKLQATQDQRRIRILSDIQDASVKLEVMRSKIRGLDQKLAYTGAARSQLIRGTQNAPGIAIFRKSGAGTERLDVGEDEGLRSGDVVEIAMKSVIPDSQ